MKRRWISIVLVLLFILPTAVLTASADAGLKRVLNVTIKGGDSGCYLTFFTASKNWSMHKAFDTDAERKEIFENALDASLSNVYQDNAKSLAKQHADLAYRRFKEYQDPDGYIFSGYGEFLNSDGTIIVYEPPEDFKILLYYPESDTVSSSGKLSPIQLHTGVTVKVENDQITSAYCNAVSSQPDLIDFIMMLNSLIVTIIVELLIALCFLFTKGKQILTVVLVNLVTLPVLNLFLAIINPPIYGSLFSFPYVLFEIAVIIVETLLYLHFLPKYSKGASTPKWRIITYAIVANLVTYAIAAFVPSYYFLAPLFLFI